MNSLMSQCRKGEQNKTWFRNGRLFSVDRDWFFSTREGPEVGPFPSRENAVNGLELYIMRIKSTEGYSASAEKATFEVVWTTN